MAWRRGPSLPRRLCNFEFAASLQLSSTATQHSRQQPQTWLRKSTLSDEDESSSLDWYKTQYMAWQTAHPRHATTGRRSDQHQRDCSQRRQFGAKDHWGIPLSRLSMRLCIGPLAVSTQSPVRSRGRLSTERRQCESTGLPLYWTTTSHQSATCQMPLLRRLPVESYSTSCTFCPFDVKAR